ncbi:protein AATF [Epargyreus clarus]|uniref:protein AATF n=1 Tax=Epargyreus clarus TaxID=520877 RepID=UPI003C2F6399
MKPKQKKSSKPILSDKIADALTVKPRADIEDDHVFHTKPKTLTRADLSSSDSEDEAAISDFRKRNVNLLSDISKKYEGKVVSRRDLKSEVSDGSGSEIERNHSEVDSGDDTDNEKIEQNSVDSDESDDYRITQFKKQLESDESGQSGEGSDEHDGEDEDDDEEGYDISQMEEPVKEEFEHVKKQNISEEAKKGNCVRSQLLLWEGLLEMRIHLQRCMNTANRMPMSDYYGQLKQSNEFVEETVNTVNNVTNVLEKLLTLQNMLYKNFPETKTLATKKQAPEQKKETKEDSDEEIPSDTDNEEIPSDTDNEDNTPETIQTPKNNNKISQKKRKLDDYETDLATSHKVFKSFRDTTIQKWNDKTRLATAANMKNAPTNTILQQISYILSDRQKLIRRTQLKRSEYDIIGYSKTPEIENIEKNGAEHSLGVRDRKDNDEYIPEIFDDSDFYHQLLRELIECKSADISDPVQLSRQWIALQQMRSKMKRKVDTKATKGRKIKYVVHNQLVNYMAPEKSLTWNEESTNELYSSLFGKMFEQNNIGVNVNLENGKIKI